MDRGKKWAVVTGASQGIGEQISYELARRGYHLVLVARSSEHLEKVKTHIQKPGLEVVILAMDLAYEGAAAELFKKVSSLPGNVEIIVNNAGFGSFGPFADSDLRECEQMMKLNMLTLTQISHDFAQYFKKLKKGYILNVASTAAFQAGPLMALYYATKAFVLHLSEAMHEELIGHGVVVSALCPGPTPTGFQKVAKMEKSALLKMAAMTTSAQVAREGVQGCLAGRAIIIPGLMNKISVMMVKLSPRFLVRRVVGWVQRES